MISYTCLENFKIIFLWSIYNPEKVIPYPLFFGLYVLSLGGATFTDLMLKETDQQQSDHFALFRRTLRKVQALLELYFESHKAVEDPGFFFYCHRQYLYENKICLAYRKFLYQFVVDPLRNYKININD